MLQFVTIAPCSLPLPATVADNRVVVEIVQQKPVAGGDLQTVLRCLWCRNKWRLGKDEAIALAGFLRGYDKYKNDYYNKVADRVIAGYK